MTIKIIKNNITSDELKLWLFDMCKDINNILNYKYLNIIYLLNIITTELVVQKHDDKVNITLSIPENESIIYYSEYFKNTYFFDKFTVHYKKNNSNKDDKDTIPELEESIDHTILNNYDNLEFPECSYCKKLLVQQNFTITKIRFYTKKLKFHPTCILKLISENLIFSEIHKFIDIYPILMKQLIIEITKIIVIDITNQEYKNIFYDIINNNNIIALKTFINLGIELNNLQFDLYLINHSIYVNNLECFKLLFNRRKFTKNELFGMIWNLSINDNIHFIDEIISDYENIINETDRWGNNIAFIVTFCGNIKSMSHIISLNKNNFLLSNNDKIFPVHVCNPSCINLLNGINITYSQVQSHFQYASIVDDMIYNFNNNILLICNNYDNDDVKINLLNIRIIIIFLKNFKNYNSSIIIELISLIEINCNKLLKLINKNNSDMYLFEQVKLLIIKALEITINLKILDKIIILSNILLDWLQEYVPNYKKIIINGSLYIVDVIDAIGNKMYNLFFNEKKYNLIVELIQKFYNFLKFIYSEDDINITVTLEKIAISYGKLNQFDKQQKLLDEILFTYENINKNNNIVDDDNSIRICNNIADLYFNNKKNSNKKGEEIEKLYKRCINFYENKNKFIDNFIDLQYKLTIILNENNKFTESKKLLDNVEPHIKEKYGHNTIIVSGLYIQKYIIYDNLEQYENALQSLKNAYDILNNFFSNEFFNIAIIKFNMSNIHYKLNNYQESMNCLNEAEKIYKTLFGDFSIHQAKIYQIQSIFYEKDEDWDSVIIVLNKSYNIYKNIGSKDDNALKIIFGLAVAYFMKKKYIFSIKFFEKILLKVDIEYTNHCFIMCILDFIVKGYNKLNKKNKEIYYSAKLLSYEKIHSKSCPHYNKILNNTVIKDYLLQ
jgi:hypothetical protein